MRANQARIKGQAWRVQRACCIPPIHATKIAMMITLTPKQEAWLKAHVARGDFPSIEEAAQQLIDEWIAERATEESDDLAWAKPCVDEALADVARGDVITLEEHEARTKALLAASKS
jgi:antitoxin ParD1/3/4